MKLRTIGLIGTLVLALLAVSLPSGAQQAGKVYRIGWLRFSPRPPTGSTHVAYAKSCTSLGMLKGRTLFLSTVPQKVSENGSPK